MDNLEESLGFSVGAKAEFKITAGKKHDLKKFKKNIQDYDLKFITIKGRNKEGTDISYQSSAIKHSCYFQINDKLDSNLQFFLKGWINEHHLENKKT